MKCHFNFKLILIFRSSKIPTKIRLKKQRRKKWMKRRKRMKQSGRKSIKVLTIRSLSQLCRTHLNGKIFMNKIWAMNSLNKGSCLIKHSFGSHLMNLMRNTNIFEIFERRTVLHYLDLACLCTITKCACFYI